MASKRNRGVSGGSGATIGRRDADRVLYQAKQQQRRDIADAREGKRGHGKHAIRKMSW